MYYPKSQILSNLYTNGTEYVFLSNPLVYYVGYYHILSNGKIFTGKNPNDGVPVRLTVPTNKEYFNGAGEEPETAIINEQYDNIRLKNNINLPFESLIEPKYFRPTPSYPSFIRYFVKKTNEIKYIEVDKDTYDKIVAKNSKYNWAMYQPFTLNWVTQGLNKQAVENANKSLVSLEERRQKLYGLSSYFTNYTEFSTYI